MIRQWNELPSFMQTDEVRPYWEILQKKRGQLVLKRAFDLSAALALAAVTAVPMAAIAIGIKLDSPGPVFYRQERITAYGKTFRIHKFRTMVTDADKIGSVVTVSDDARITHIGKKLRHFRLDELPQCFDVICGNMSFVGARPEVSKYVRQYKPEYNATFLLPAGITSEASIRFKDEAKLLDGAEDVDKAYTEMVLPQKMRWNLETIEHFSFPHELLTMFRTVCAVCGKTYD